jgi:hypothetical protein
VKRKLAEARVRRTNPPDPGATTILAAVLADDSLWDAVQVRMRPISKGHFVNGTFRNRGLAGLRAG